MDHFGRHTQSACYFMSTWPPPGNQPQPYASPGGFQPYSQPPPQSKLWVWVLLAVGGLTALCCCGGGVAVVSFGMNIVTEEVAAHLRDNPKFREHVGELQDMNVDWPASIAEDDDDTFVYGVKGDKGSGKITVKHITNDDGDEEVLEASLRLPDGTKVQIVP